MEFDVVIVGAGPGRARRRDPAQAAVARARRGGGREGLRGRRAYPVRRGDRSDRPRPAAAGMAERGHPDQDRGHATTASTWLGPSAALRLPNFMMPPLMSNHGNFIVSLGNVCRWLATKAEALGVEIYPGFAATEVLIDDGAVAGVATGDMGIGKDGKPRGDFTRGMELRAKYTLFAEGARGSLSKQLIAKYGLAEGREPQKFGLGLEGALAGRARTSTSPAWCSTRSAGRSTIPPAAARSSTTSTTIWFRSASSSISTTPIPICRRSRNSSASRPIRRSAARSRAASGCPMARAPSPRAATSRCRSFRSRAAR